MNVTRDELIGISCGDDHRYTALFCDRVVPLSSALTVPESIKLSVELPKDHPEEIANFDHFFAKVIATTEDNREDVIHVEMRKYEENRALILHKFLADRGLRSVPYFYDNDSYDGYMAQGDGECVEFKFLNAPLIDINSVTWDHITELRRDLDFKRKLRAFRLLFEDDYSGKGINYVTDSLLKRIDDYEQACKRNGVELMLSSCQNILSSKSLLGSLGLVAAGILTGNPGIIAASAVSGAVIELGRLSIHVAQKKLEFDRKSSADGIAYLADIRRKT